MNSFANKIFHYYEFIINNGISKQRLKTETEMKLLLKITNTQLHICIFIHGLLKLYILLF